MSSKDLITEDANSTNKRIREEDSEININKIIDGKRFKPDEESKEKTDENQQITPQMNTPLHFEKLSSTLFQSNFKNSFLNAIWKIIVPSKDLDANFRTVEKFEGRPNYPCDMMLDYSEKWSEFSLVIRIGEGEDIEKHFETEKLINGLNDSIVIEINNQNSHPNLVNDSPVENGNNNHFPNTNNNPLYNVKKDENEISNITPASTPKHCSEDTVSMSDVHRENNKNSDSPARKENTELLYFNLLPRHKNDDTPKLSDKNNSHNDLEDAEKARLNSDADDKDKDKYNNENDKKNKFPLLSPILSNNTDKIKANDTNEKMTETFNLNLQIYIINYHFFSFNNVKVSPGDVITHKFKISKDVLRRAIKQDPQIISEISVIKNNSSQTEFIGIINEGMTCYMNSMLQTLNILGYFKRAVFQIPIVDQSQSVSYSLQKIFYDLMTETKPISTMRLIKSFGWGREELLVQHDVQEFNLILSDIMEEKMRGTSVEGTFKYLFEGRAYNYIQCVHVDYKSHKEEHFNDIQLTVKGCKTIYDSFDKYTEEETLDNEDKYYAEGFGKQVAKKGIKFKQLPNVLILQLKRFEYDFARDVMEKVNDYFEFYETINLNKYMLDTNNNNTEGNNNNNNTFTLHSVMVHAGSANAGHYYAFIKPGAKANEESKWSKFNDDVVKSADRYEVFENTFGGTCKTYKHFNNGNVVENQYKSDANAYILVYIKNKERENILCPLTLDDVPISVKNLFEADKKEEKRLMLLNQRQNNNFNITIFSKEILLNHKALGLVNSFINVDEEDVIANKSYNRMTLNVPKDMRFGEFVIFLSSLTNIPKEKIKLFKYGNKYPLNLLKRSVYEMNHINETLYYKRLSDIYEIKPSRTIYLLYIHILNDSHENYSILRVNQNYTPAINSFTEGINSNSNSNSNNFNFGDEEEYIFNESTNQIVYFNKNNNYWRINTSNLIPSSFPHSYSLPETNFEHESKNDVELVDDYILCVIKYIKVKLFINEDNTKSQKSFVIEDIIALRKDLPLNNLKDKINFKENYKKYLDPNFIAMIPQYEQAFVNFIICYTSLDNCGKNGRVNFKTVSQCSVDKPVIGFQNDAVCLVVDLSWTEKINFEDQMINSLQELIKDCADNYLSSVKLPFFFIQDKKNDIVKPFEKGIKLNVQLNWSNIELKTFLHNKLKEEKFKIEDLIDQSEIEYFIYTYENELVKVTDYVKSNSDVIVFDQYGQNDKEYSQFYDPFPVLEHIYKKQNLNNNNLYIPFAFSFIPQEYRNQFHYLIVTLFDKDNNPIVKLGLSLSKLSTNCNDIFNFLDENKIIDKFYPNEILTEKDELQNKENNIEKGKLKRNKQTFYFIVQNPKTLIAYDIFVDINTLIRKYEINNIPIEYRLQPYSTEESKLICNRNKIFVAIINKEFSICYPMIIFLDLAIHTMGHMKAVVIEKMNKIKKIRNVDLSNTNRIKFYSGRIIDYKAQKGFYFSNNIDNDLIEKHYAANNPNNLVVEVPYYSSSSSMVINSS